jgi:hypothetical protein
MTTWTAEVLQCCAVLLKPIPAPCILLLLLLLLLLLHLLLLQLWQQPATTH